MTMSKETTVSSRNNNFSRPSQSFNATAFCRINLKLYHHVLLAIVILLTAKADGFSPDSTTEEPANISPSSFQSGSAVPFECSNLPVRDQRRYCSNTTGFKQALIEADKYAREECEFWFKDHKWKCYGLSLLHGSNATKRASKESGFIHTIISAMLTYSITDACDKNLMSCSSYNEGVEVIQNNEFNHTIITKSHVLYGMMLAERFLNSQEYSKQGLTGRHRLNRHNNNIGWQIVSSSTKPQCQCHSASVGCTVKTCKATLPERRTISALVEKKYQKAVRVKFNRRGDKFLPYSSTQSKSIERTDMIYFETSPNYCYRDISVGSPGVKGQECNPKGGKNEPGSCDNICCGRGHVKEKVEYESDCCTFVWCCTVECSKCKKEYTFHKCR